jgi:arylformamidase
METGSHRRICWKKDGRADGPTAAGANYKFRARKPLAQPAPRPAFTPLPMPDTDHTDAADLSHVIEHDMVTYKGLPAPIICDYLTREASKARFAPGTEFQIGSIEMVGNTGTYIDSPFHRFANGKDLADLPLPSLTDLRCLVVDCRERSTRAINTVPFGADEIRGAAVLFFTGWDVHWRSEQYHDGHPYVSASLATVLRDAGATLVGIDSFNIDCTDDGERPVHTTLLGADIPIVEHLRGLAQLPMRGARFFAVPPKVRGFGTFPVRAFALR